MTATRKSPHLPTRDGVSASSVALPAGTWHTVFDFLCDRFPAVSQQEWTARFDEGLVLDAQGAALSATQPYLPHSLLHYYRRVPDEPELPFKAQVLFQDAHLVVADKPHFMPVTPAGRYVRSSLLVQLKEQLGIDTLSPLHRIDRETAGLVLFAIVPHERDVYQAVLRERQLHKLYQAVAPVRRDLTLPLTYRSRLESSAEFFRSHEVPGEPNSETTVRLLKTESIDAKENGLYELEPVTGQRHQLRIHMHALGLPIEGDQFYPTVLRGPTEAEDFQQPLQLLAQRIAFTDPLTGEARAFHSAQALRLAL